MINQIYIDAAILISSDEAGLIAAGIDIDAVNKQVSVAEEKQVAGCELARQVRDMLIRNLETPEGYDQLQPESIFVIDGGNMRLCDTEAEVTSSQEHGFEPIRAMFNAERVLAWLVEHIQMSNRIKDAINWRLKKEENKRKVTPIPFYHVTKHLELAAEVQKRYWSDGWDPEDSTTQTTQSVICDWLQQEFGINKKMAKEVAIIACPVDRQKHNSLRKKHP